MENEKFLNALLDEFRRRVFDESMMRMAQCLNMLSDEQVWFRPNEKVVSVGNLVLHLCGNGRQWIVAGLGAEPDHRKRSEEFETPGPIAKSDLLQMLYTLKKDMEEVLKILKPEDLFLVRKVQTFEETGMAILMHVMEHFSYHTGQITLHTKLMTQQDTAYYKNTRLDV
jgi:uncharacterized damage-inducible protein DinB